MRRNTIQPDQTITLESRGTNGIYRKSFTITQALKMGGSSICYQAYTSNSGKGILKEYYPVEAFAGARDEDGHLTFHEPGFECEYEKFKNGIEEYLKPYEMLLEFKREDENLATFIPAFEIYHGPETVYIWSPEPKLKTFDEIVDDIHNFPDIDSGAKILRVLKAVQSLTECTALLHKRRIIHRDIKPQNFGFFIRDNNVLTDSIYLFDVNTIHYTLSSIAPDPVKSEGYTSALADGKPEVRHDIYSIGATLFNALVMTDEARKSNYLYKSRYHGRIDEMIEQSEIIRYSDFNKDKAVCELLSEIISDCLNDYAEVPKYETCDDLKKDIDKLIDMVLSKMYRKKSDPNDKNTRLVMFYHLYEHPLYSGLQPGKGDINVSVVGFDAYGQRFLDAVLQIGQMLNKRLKVKVYLDNDNQDALYLKCRPALKKFFNVDGCLKKDENSYGDINFIHSKDAGKAIKAAESEEVSSDYIFISLGTNEKNKKVSKEVKILRKKKPSNVFFAMTGFGEIRNNRNFGIPVYVDKKAEDSHLFNDIERMAFNMHLVWEKNLNIPFKKVYEEFRKPYNHDSCVSGVVSMKHKLYSVSINLDKNTTTFEWAAKKFCEYGFNEHNKKNSTKKNLIWLEHRRWVAEKVCLGWTPITDYSECLTGKTKDEFRKKHICLCFSSPDIVLDYNSPFWGETDEKKLSKLDELDRMSVEFNNLLKEEGGKMALENILNGETVAKLNRAVEFDKKARIALCEWLACMTDVCYGGDIKAVRLYKSLKNAFLDSYKSIEGVDKNRVSEVSDLVKKLDAQFYPIWGAVERRIWKDDDVNMVEQIPFILTYTRKSALVIPFSTGNSDDVFNNVAAPLIVAPSTIYYVCKVINSEALDEMYIAVDSVTRFMNRKNMNSDVRMIVYYNADKVGAPEKIEVKTKNAGNGRISFVKLLPYCKKNKEEAKKTLYTYLKAVESRKDFFAVESIEDNSIDDTLESFKFPGYTFNSDNMTFECGDDVEMLKHINKKTSILVSDMFEFSRSTPAKMETPELFNEYEDLWNLYDRNPKVWKRATKYLAEYANKKDVVGTIGINTPFSDSPNTKKASYHLPAECMPAAVRIVEKLKEKNAISQNSNVCAYSSHTCDVTIFHDRKEENYFDKVFKNVDALMSPYVDFPDKSSTALTVSTSILEVKNLKIEEQSKADNELKPLVLNLFEEFEKKGYIYNYSYDNVNRTVSFKYTSHQYKQVLSKEGKILEVYVYHKLKNSGCFSDVVSSYEVEWYERELKNEFDGIAVRDYEMAFIECKAVEDLERTFYDKLNTLVGRFGVNAKTIMIADTRENKNKNGGNRNDKARVLGNAIEIITISNPKDIADIDKTIISILDK